MSETDLFYLEDEELARQLVELNYRGSGEALSRKEFCAQREAAGSRSTRAAAAPTAPVELASAGKDVAASPFLQALADREALVRSGELTTVIFLRDRNARGQEVSGYIDYGARLRAESFEPYFERRKKRAPRPTDLSYLNWDTQRSATRSSADLQVLADAEEGLVLKSKRDRKLIRVDPAAPPGDGTTRCEIRSDEYLQTVLYDHPTRRKS